MIYGLFAFILLTDLVIIGFFYYWYKKTKSDHSIGITEITDERMQLEKLKKEICEALTVMSEENINHHRKMQHIAAELEVESKDSQKIIEGRIDEIISEHSIVLDQKIQLAQKRQSQMQLATDRAGEKKTELQRMIIQCEDLLSLFHKNLPYDELVLQLKDKKYHDARRLLAKGRSGEDIAKETGLRVEEIDLIKAGCSPMGLSF